VKALGDVASEDARDEERDWRKEDEEEEEHGTGVGGGGGGKRSGNTGMDEGGRRAQVGGLRALFALVSILGDSNQSPIVRQLAAQEIGLAAHSLRHRRFLGIGADAVMMGLVMDAVDRMRVGDEAVVEEALGVMGAVASRRGEYEGAQGAATRVASPDEEAQGQVCDR
jgi:hypothetical protein